MMKSSIKTICTAVVLGICAACSHTGGPAINEKEMSGIISDIYLVDQWAKVDNKVSMRADTTLIYNAVFMKYGYTFEQYMSSMEYYVRNWKKYLRILDGAYKILIAGAQEADELYRLDGMRLKAVVRTPLLSDKSLFGKWWNGTPAPFRFRNISPSKVRIPYKLSASAADTDDGQASVKETVYVNTAEQGYDSGEWKVRDTEDEDVIDMQQQPRKKDGVAIKPEKADAGTEIKDTAGNTGTSRENK